MRTTGSRRIGAALAGALCACLAAGGALAAPKESITIALPGGPKVERMKVPYSCDGGLKVQAEYFNAAENSLATLSFKGKFVILANVIAGSGAKYAGAQYIWWTKGDNADLYDLMKGETASPVSCKSTP